ncbi:putative polysaccharide biosynthesis protein [Anaerostipes sp. MSJ-23]|uniref:putative polysaccharide biosynthesis protein n=1 Tax=Anaerostipes sp. MSJ-23 TaxID=2841520 RepID=UPI001C128547|nr:polysaccharide biosynthesis protein [Anaerostipes sp. MSJ-23]MBU5460476.1 polysaccharide biosynthesis protein [Anaerostipes sp. MSJ-23]
MNTGKKNSFLVQGMILAAASIVCRIIGLLYRSPLFDIIGKAGMGYYSVAYNIYNIILLISSFSIPLAVSKSISARLAKKEYINAQRIFYGALVYAAVVGGVAALVAWYGAPVFVGKQQGAVLALRCISPTIFFSAILGVLRGYFQGHNTMIPTSVSQIIEQILNAIFSILMAYVLIQPFLPSDSITYEIARHGAAGSAIGTEVGVITGLIFCLFIYKVYHPKSKIQMRHDKTKYIESYGNILKILLMTITPVILSTAIYNCCPTIDMTLFSSILVGKGMKAFHVSELYGVFSGQYNVLINIPLAMASALTNAVIPNISGAYALGDKKKMNENIEMVLKITMMIAIPCAVGLAVLNTPINGLIFGVKNGVGLGAGLLRVGAISVVFTCMSTVSNGILQGMDKMRVPIWHSAISVCANVIVLLLTLNFTNLNTYSLVWATTGFSVVMSILNANSIRKYSGYRQEVVKTFVKPAVSAILMGVVIGVIQFVLLKVLPFGRIGFAICLVIAIPAGVLVYFAGIIKFQVFTEEELKNVPKGHLIIKMAKKLRLL